MLNGRVMKDDEEKEGAIRQEGVFSFFFIIIYFVCTHYIFYFACLSSKFTLYNFWMDPLWNGEPPYYTNHTSTYYHQLNIPSVSSPITTTTTMTMTPSITNEVIVNGIRMGENELVNIYQENNSNTFNFPRYETIECPYTEPPPPSIGGGYHSSTTPIQRGPSTTSNSIGHDNNDLINDPYYYTEHQNPRTSRDVYFNNEENQSYVNNHYNIYNNMEELYDGGNNSDGNVNDGGIRNIQRDSTPTTILSEPPINFTSLEDDEPLVSEDQLQDEMDHFENMLSKFSSKDLDENCPDLTCDDMLNCFETSIDDNFLKLFDSIESSPEVTTSKNSLVSPINDILEDECTDNAGDEEEENKKDKTKIDNNSNGKKKCITCCKEIIKNVFKLSQDKFKSSIYCSSQCIKKKLQEWGEKCKNRKTIEVKLFDDDNVKKKMPFDDAYKFLKKSPFYVPVFIEDKGIEDGDSSNDNEKKEEMLRNGFKKLTFKIFLLLLKKNEIEAGKERMVKAFINELERQIFEKFMGKDYCDYKKFARYFMHNQEKPEKKILYLNLLRRRMSIGELLKMPLKEVKHGIKVKKENGQSISSISSSILFENISDSCNNSNNKSIKNQKKNSCTPVKVNSNGKVPESHEGETLSLVDSLLGDTNDDTTSKHLNHLYDSNCKICQEKKSKEERLIREREEAVAEREAKRKRREMEIEMRIREEKMNLLKREMEEKKKMEKNLYNVTLHDGSHNIPLTIYPIKNPDLFILKDEMPRRLKNINHVRNINALKEVFEISIDSLTSRVMVCIVEADGNVGDENFLKYRKYLFKERLGIIINFEDSNLLKSFSLIPLDSFADIPDLLFDLPGYEISLFDFSTKFVGVFILEDQKLLDIFTSPPKPPILKNITKTTDAKESGDKKCCDKNNIRQDDDDDANDSKITEKIINDDFKCHNESNDQPSSTPTYNIDKNITSSSEWMPMLSDTPKNETVSSPEPIITTHVGFKIPSLEMSEPPVPPSIELKSNSNVDVQEEEQQPSQGGGKANKRKRSRKNRKSRNNKKRTRENSNNQSHSKFSGLSNVRREFRSPLGPYHPRPDRRPTHNYLHDNDNVRMVEDRYNHVQSIPYNGSPLYQHQPSPSSSSLNGGVYSPRNSIPSLPRYSFSTPPSYNSRPILPLLKQEPYIKPLMEQTIVLGPQFNQPSPPNPSMYSSRIPQGISCPQSMYGNNIHSGQQQQRPPQNNYYHHQQSSGNTKHHHYQQPYYNNFSRSRRF